MQPTEAQTTALAVISNAEIIAQWLAKLATIAHASATDQKFAPANALEAKVSDGLRRKIPDLDLGVLINSQGMIGLSSSDATRLVHHFGQDLPRRAKHAFLTTERGLESTHAFGLDGRAFERDRHDFPVDPITRTHEYKAGVSKHVEKLLANQPETGIYR